jgi:hypothetical protein
VKLWFFFLITNYVIYFFKYRLLVQGKVIETW